MAAKINSVDMINGSMWGKILKFSLVYMLTAVLQQLYSAADVIVVGRYAGEQALAGVGTCTVLINLFLNFILGLSAGGTIVLGQAIGAGNDDSIEKTTHTAIAVATYGGLIISVICLIFTKQLLALIDVPDNVVPQASVYLRITAIGFIPSLVYNFGSAILRAKGDTKRALYIVTISGIINLLLNLFFVCVVGMKAGGVALATITSQFFTAVCILYILCNESDKTRLNLRKIKLYKQPFLKMLRFGIPSGIQSSVYSVSNILVQSSVNSFGSAAIAGASAATSITNFYSMTASGMYQASIVFTSQNYGAKKFNRIKSVLAICMVYSIGLWAIQTAVTFLAGKTLLGLYAPNDPAVVEYGWRKLGTIGWTYGFLVILDVMSGMLRGMGASFINMITSIVGVCGIRIVWILTGFRIFGTFESLYVCYPLSWLGTSCLHLIMFIIIFNKEKRKSQL